MRCAIYTRKSSEEGLDQSFNSLHAQREYCEAYIKSQGGGPIYNAFNLQPHLVARAGLRSRRSLADNAWAAATQAA